MKNRLIYLVCLFLLNMCVQHSEKEPGETATPSSNSNGILIIFNKKVAPEKKRTKSGLVNVNKPQLRYIDDFGIEQKFVSLNESSMDTVSIVSSRPFVSLQHRYFQMDKFDFLFKNGDTVMFTYKKGIPYARILNQPDRKFETNYEYYKRKRFNQLDQLQGQFYYDLSNFEHTSVEDKYFAETSIGSNKIENEYLDSLFKAGTISDKVHYFHKKRLDFELYEMSLSKKYGNYFYTYIDQDFIEAQITNKELFYHKYFLDAVVKFIQFKYEVSRIRSSSVTFLNYKQAFDSVAANRRNFDYTISDILLSRLAEGVIQNFSFEDSKEVIDKLSQITNNEKFIEQLKDRYLLSEEFSKIKNLSEKLYLLSKDKENYSFKEIKEKHFGKVLYIDFWASWCSPCRQAMPASYKLRQDYGRQDVVFIYLSTDQHFKNWKKAISQLNLEHYSESYMIINNEKSDFIIDLGIKSIPRYLLFDKKGNMVHQNAPGPEGEQIRKLIDKYLTK